MLAVQLAVQLADKVEESPAHMVVGDALAVTVGNGFTTMVAVPVPVHPEAFVTVTV